MTTKRSRKWGDKRSPLSEQDEPEPRNCGVFFCMEDLQ
jgi:hypothetical protein